MTLFSILPFLKKCKHVFLISILLIVITKKNYYELKYARFHEIEKIIQTSSKKLKSRGCRKCSVHLLFCWVRVISQKRETTRGTASWKMKIWLEYLLSNMMKVKLQFQRKNFKCKTLNVWQELLKLFYFLGLFSFHR